MTCHLVIGLARKGLLDERHGPAAHEPYVRNNGLLEVRALRHVLSPTHVRHMTPDQIVVVSKFAGRLVKEPEAFMWRYPAVPVGKILGTYSGSLNNAGERLELSMPGDVDEYGTRYYIRVDRVGYSDGSHPEDCPGGVDLWPREADGGGK